MYYEEYGSGVPLIFLHGWGASLDTFKAIAKHFVDYRVVLVDLPGFGKSEEPSQYNLDYYVEELNKLILAKGYDNPIILGHSFGGRVAIKYASKYKVNKLILVSSAGIKHHGLKYYSLVYLHKIKRKLGIKSNMGSSDYKNASSIMKKVLVSATNESLIGVMKEIKCGTLLIYGEDDLVTPVSDAVIIERYIRNSGLVIIPKTGHFCYLENPRYFLLVVDSFLSSDVG